MKKAAEFIRKYNLGNTTITTDLAENVIKTQGFEIVRYGSCGNCRQVHSILTLLNLSEYAHTATSFTYCDAENKFVFIRENLNSDDLLYALLHEEGHIFCEHPFKDGLFDNTQTAKEREANSFAECILGGNRNNTRPRFFILMCTVVCLFLIISVSSEKPNSNINTSVMPDTKPTGVVYVTSSGTKYHGKDCFHIKNKNNVTSIDVEKAKALGYEPCKICGGEK